MKNRNTILSFLGVVFTLGLPCLPISRWENEFADVPHLVGYEIIWWVMIAGVLSYVVGEEVLFRGYAIERGQELTGSKTIAAVLSCLVFTLAHLGTWGWGHLLIAVFGGLVFTLLYLWRRKLWINIIAHFMVDGVAVLLG